MKKIIALLSEKSILVLLVLSFLGGALLLGYVSYLQQELIESSAIANARLYSQALSEFRSVYTSEVVNRVRAHGIQVTHEYQKQQKSIPLPATLSMLLGNKIGEHRSGAQTRLYSPYPFPWRKQTGGLRSEFEEQAWQYLQEHPEQPFHRIEEYQGRLSLRYATADRMHRSCVECHNTHPQTPKDNWREGDIRGVLEVIHPLDHVVEQNSSNLRRLFFLVSILSIFGLTGLTVAINKLRGYSLSLEQKVQDRTKKLTNALEDLQKAQAQLVHSEKMAALGQFVGGISHEINTPAAAIYNAVASLQKNSLPLLQQWLEITEKIPSDTKSAYIEACGIVLAKAHEEISTRDQRKLARGIARKLTEYNIEESREWGQDLAQIGFSSENIEKIMPLLISEYGSTIFQSLYNLGTHNIRIHDIQIAIDRIHQLAKALKHYIHLDQGELIATDLRQDLDNTLIILRNKLKRAITVHKEYQEIPPLRCRADQLNQVWTNLIHNAIQAMQGEGHLYLRLQKWSDNEIAVEVEDTGPGIPPEVASRIFEAYFTTKQKGEGAGMGLYIGKEIIEKHGGTIGIAHNKPGKTCFRVILPITRI